MKALLLIAHGSRRQESNDAIQQMAEHLQDTDQSFDMIGYGFLELTKPDINDGMDELIKAGATEIIILPYFLAPGWHVVRDIPEIIDQMKDQNPEIKISMLPHIGSTEGMKRLLLMQIQQASFQS